MRCRDFRLGVGLAWFAATVLAHAAPISLTGQLDPNNAQDVVLHPFTLASPGTVTIQSWGYGGSAGAPGGLNAQGAAIAGGGFDPYVTLFSGSGATATFLASNDDGSCPPGTIAAALCGDSTLVTGVLPAGAYTLAISAFLNMSFAENLGSGNLGDGFIGLGSFGTRTNAYAVDISGATVAAPTLLLSHVPNGLTFGPQTHNVASGPLVVVVKNTGSASVSVGALTDSGPDAARFSTATTCGGALAPAATCAITVVFTPTAVGPASASLSLASNASNAPNTIALGGTGTTDPVAVAALSATNLDFGTLTIGAVATLPLQVTNTGGVNLSIASVALAGAAEFAILSDGCTGQSVAPAANCTVTVRFSPMFQGLRNGTITITSNASNSPAQVALAGRGAVPEPIPALAPGLLALLSLLVAAAGGAAGRAATRSRGSDRTTGQ